MEGLICLGIVLVVGLPIIGICLAAAALRRIGRLEERVTLLSERQFVLLDRSQTERGGQAEARPEPGAAKEPAGEPGGVRLPRWQAPEAAPPTSIPLTPAAQFRQPLEPLAAESAPPTAPPRKPFTASESARPQDAAVASPPPAPPEQPAKPTITLEERLGTRALVWVGGVALALAGVFLVKYSFDKNLLTPLIRVVAGLLFGGALIGAAEYMRPRSTRIGQALAAAGIADMFACLLAAVNAYELIDPLKGFAAMSAVTALAVLLSLRHGPFVALLGLLGGFLTPALINTGEARPSLFAYLLLLEMGLVAVSRRRGWFILTGLTLVGGMFWAAAWLGAGWYQPAHSLWLGVYLLASVALFAFSAHVGRDALPRTERIVAAGLTWAGAALAMFLLMVQLDFGDFGTLEWGYIGLLGAGCLVLARLHRHQYGLAWMAMILTLVMFALWYRETSPTAHPHFGVTLLVIGVLYAAGGYVAQFGAARPFAWTAFSAAAAIAFFVIAYAFMPHAPWSLRWGHVAVIIAGFYAAGSVPVARRRLYGGAGDDALTAMLAGIVVLVSAAIYLDIRPVWIAVALALEIPALAMLERWLKLASLRGLAAILAALVLQRLLLNSDLPTYPLSETPLNNWFWYGFGIPAAALGIAAWLFNRIRRDEYAAFLIVASVVAALALVTLEIRHYFHPEDPFITTFPLTELSGQMVAWLIAACVLLRLSRLWKHPALGWCGATVGVLALGIGTVMLLLAKNPIVAGFDPGAGRVFNLLLPVYLLPAAAVFLLAYELRRSPLVQAGAEPSLPGISSPSAAEAGPRAGVAVLPANCEYIAWLLIAMLVTLEVRQWHHPQQLNTRHLPLAEIAALVVAWSVMGIGLILVARRWAVDTMLWMGRILAVLGVAVGLIGLGLTHNPAWRHEPVGETAVFNYLLLMYGLPAALTGVIAWLFRREGFAIGSRLTGIGALLLLFLLITLEVRQGFRGMYLDAGSRSAAEGYAYSLAWGIFGIGLLVTGIVTRGVVLRYASLAVMMLTACKVFLWDTAQLRDLWRVFSFLGLGASLMLLAWLYQRFVFRAPVRREALQADGA